jgi:hypothetical protein
MATYQCDDRLHGGEPTSADFFIREVDEKGEVLYDGKGWSACEEHTAIGLAYLAPEDGGWAQFKIRRISDEEKAEFYDIQDQLKAARDAK